MVVAWTFCGICIAPCLHTQLICCELEKNPRPREFRLMSLWQSWDKTNSQISTRTSYPLRGSLLPDNRPETLYGSSLPSTSSLHFIVVFPPQPFDTQHCQPSSSSCAFILCSWLAGLASVSSRHMRKKKIMVMTKLWLFRGNWGPLAFKGLQSHGWSSSDVLEQQPTLKPTKNNQGIAKFSLMLHWSKPWLSDEFYV